MSHPSTRRMRRPFSSSGMLAQALKSCTWPRARYMRCVGQLSKPSKMWVACVGLLLCSAGALHLAMLRWACVCPGRGAETALGRSPC